jgi:hypothetical protein
MSGSGGGMVYAVDSKSTGREAMWVRVPPRALVLSPPLPAQPRAMRVEAWLDHKQCADADQGSSCSCINLDLQRRVDGVATTFQPAAAGAVIFEADWFLEPHRGRGS